MKDPQARQDIEKCDGRIGDLMARVFQVEKENRDLRHKLGLVMDFVGAETYTVPEKPMVPAIPAVPAHLALRKIKPAKP